MTCLKNTIAGWLLLLPMPFAVHAESSSVDQVTDDTGDLRESKAVIEQAIATSASNAKKNQAASEWIPSAIDFDWIQLTSNEWLKGEIKGMYKEKLEFDSDKLGLLDIDWEDVRILRSHQASSINIDDVGAHYGILEVTDNNIKIINDYEDQIYERSRLISFAPGGANEKDLWSAKVSLGLDLRAGNTDQVDYTARLNIKRRASLTRFLLDYIGNITRTSSGNSGLVETINNHRLTGSFDYYKTRHFFYTPVFFEFYRDPFTNISLKTTIGGGIGYTVIDDADTELSFSGGPAYVQTDFSSVAAGEPTSESTIAAVLRTNYDVEVSSTMDFIARYHIQVGNEASGGYTHHIILTLENEITGSLDIDTSVIWDRTSNPARAADGTSPLPDDFRLTVGISYSY